MLNYHSLVHPIFSFKLCFMKSLSAFTVSFCRRISKSLFGYFAAGVVLLLCSAMQTALAQSPVTVTLNPSKDNTIYEHNTSNSNGAGEFLIAGTTGSPYFNHALIMFDITGSIPAGAVIQTASLRLHLAGTSGNSGPYKIELHKLQKNFGEGSSNAGPQAGQGAPATSNDATWLHNLFSTSLWTNPGGDFTPVSSAATVVGGIGFYTWDSVAMITDIQNWLNNPSTNYGWLLKSNELSSFQAKKFESRENPVAANRPVLSITYTLGDNDKWTWVKGDSTFNNPGIYTNTVSTTARPGARTNAASWKDGSGNFWLFGGSGYDASTSGLLNDLWKFDPVFSQWTWVKGDTVKSSRGSYGMMGMSSATNKPGSRTGTCSWKDNSGNFWLMGGLSPFPTFPSGPAFHGDLWKFSPLTNEWTWMNGDSLFNQNAKYNTRLVPAQDNHPGNRYNAVSWKDLSGSLWLFGGNGLFDLNNGVRTNAYWRSDMWKYDPLTNQWTWMKGDSTVGSSPFINYGVKGVSAPGNQPGPLQGAVNWVDSAGNFWLFGGLLQGKYRNDLWKYNPGTNEWTWVFGDSTGNNPATYGIKGVLSPGNKPGARNLSMGWTDADGNLILFGGSGVTASQSGFLDDLWKYNVQTNQWVWLSGDTTINERGVYGTKGIAATTNKPGARNTNIGWADQMNNLWLFGGFSPFGNYNDLWKYTPVVPNLLPSVTITTPANNSVFAAGNPITLNASATDTDGTITKVAFYNAGIKFLEDSAAPYGLVSTDAEPGNYALTAIATDNNGATKVSDTVKITITGCAAAGTITGEGYPGIPGTQVADLIANPAYPNNPSITAQLNSFEYANVGDNYGARVRGYLCAPQTGNYTFYVAGDEQAGLWLSTNDNPANKTLIAYNETTVGFRAWTTFATQKSAPIHLVKGARYYIETLHKQGTGTNHLSVGWVLPDGTGQGPIPGNSLSPIAAPSGARTIQDFAVAMNAVTTAAHAFKVTVSPNPSSDKFTLVTSSNNEKPLSVVVTDVRGRVIEKKQQVAANGIILLGSPWHAGVYFVEVTQDGKKQRLKLVKQ